MSTGAKIAIVAGVLVVAYLYEQSQGAVSATAVPLGVTGAPLAIAPGSPIVPPPAQPSYGSRVLSLAGGAAAASLKGTLAVATLGLSTQTGRNVVKDIGGGIKGAAVSTYHAIASVF